MKHLLLISLLASAVTGCTDDLADESAVVQEQGGCTQSNCSNSPELAHYGLWEANIHGEWDADQVAIRSMNGNAYLTKGTTRYYLYVAGGKLFGWYASKTTPLMTISGDALAGSVIELTKAGNAHYNIYIAAVHHTAAFVVGTPSTIETYTLRWYDPGSTPSAGKSLCNQVLPPSPYNKQFELAGMYPEDTVLFEGDRFDPGKKTTTDAPDTNWFNFGCAGHTLAKLYVNRATYFTQPQPDWAMRQTMLKALSADYCGTGTSYTLAGEPLVWKGGLQPNYPALPAGHPITSVDARWYEGGAICYDEPRIKVTTSLSVIGTPLADPETAIRAECPALKKCMDHDWNDMDGAKLVTANWVP